MASSRFATTRAAGASIVFALLAIAPGCADDDGPAGGTCSPTTQTETDPTGAAAFCTSLYETVCHRGFTDCVAELEFTLEYASEAECAASMTSFCDWLFADSWYDPGCGEACLAYAATARCSAFNGPEPQACAVAVGTF